MHAGDTLARLQKARSRLELKYGRQATLAELSAEVEMPEDETIDPLGEQIDLWAVMTEALALALPAYPRADRAELETDSAIPPGAAPIEEEETKPFAALADLKKKLEDKGE